METGTDLTVRTLMDWLQGQTNRSILIQKKEDNDMDRVRLQLEEVGFRPDYKSIDGYTDGTALVLHGTGTIRTETAAEAPLPGDSYVIPVSGLTVSKAADGGVIIRTDRAHYSISAEASDRH